MTLQNFHSPSVYTRGQRCINTYALEFAESVDNCELHWHRTQQSHPLRNVDGLYPSVETSMIMACVVNILQLSVKYRRTVSVSRNVGDCALCMTNYVCITYLSSCNVTFPYPG